MSRSITRELIILHMHNVYLDHTDVQVHHESVNLPTHAQGVYLDHSNVHVHHESVDLPTHA